MASHQHLFLFCALVFCFLPISCSIAGVPIHIEPLNPVGKVVLSIYSYGAVGDGKTDDTQAIQRTFDACIGIRDGCVIWFPPNGTYLSYPVYMSTNNSVLQIDGEALLPAYNETVYKVWPADAGVLQAWFSLNTTEFRYFNISIQGYGRVNGQGSGWWPFAKQLSRPTMLFIDNVEHLLIQDLMLFEAPAFHIIPYNCDNVTVRNVTILTNSSGPGTDGVDPTKSTNVHIYNTSISNGDDCVAVKDSSSNILVENCTFTNGDGASVGSTAGDSSNITFRFIECYYTQSGARVKTRPSGAGTVKNVTFHDFIMYGVHQPIALNQFCHGSGELSDNSITDITFAHMTLIDSPGPTFFFNCSNNNPCTDIVLRNITSLKMKRPDPYVYPCVSIDIIYEEVTPPLNGTATSGVFNCPPNPARDIQYIEHECHDQQPQRKRYATKL